MFDSLVSDYRILILPLARVRTSIYVGDKPWPARLGFSAGSVGRAWLVAFPRGRLDSRCCPGRDVGSKEHDGSGFFFRERIAEAARVAANEIELKLVKLGSRDADVGEFAQSGVDSVDDLVVVEEALDESARFGHPGAGVLGQFGLDAGEEE